MSGIFKHQKGIQDSIKTPRINIKSKFKTTAQERIQSRQNCLKRESLCALKDGFSTGNNDSSQVTRLPSSIRIHSLCNHTESKMDGYDSSIKMTDRHGEQESTIIKRSLQTDEISENIKHKKEKEVSERRIVASPPSTSKITNIMCEFSMNLDKSALKSNCIRHVFEYDSNTSFPYTILDCGFNSKVRQNKKHSDKTLIDMVVCQDTFDTQERFKIFLSPVAKKYPGMQILLWNYPGQSFTKFSDSKILNNEFLASCLDKLMGHVGSKGTNDFNDQELFYIMGVGCGGAVATFYATKYQPLKLRGIFLVNGLSFVDSHFARVFHDCSKVFKYSPESRPDLPIYYYARFLFSPEYLKKTTAPLALNLHTAVHNPITLHGRIRLSLGMFRHVDVRPMLKNIVSPIISIYGKASSLVRPMHALHYLKGREKCYNIYETLKQGRNKSVVIVTDGGHDLIQEKKELIYKITEKILTGHYETSSVSSPCKQVGFAQEESKTTHLEENSMSQALVASTPSPSVRHSHIEKSDVCIKRKQNDAYLKELDSINIRAQTNEASREKNNAKEYMSWRVKRNKKRLSKFQKAARIIQSSFKIYAAKATVQCLKRTYAAINIQRCHRGKLGVLVVRNHRELVWATRFFQKVYRGYLGRLKCYKKRSMIESQIKLSRNWRSFVVRCTMKNLIARRNDAATYLQCLWRKVRSTLITFYLRRNRNGTIMLQRICRGHKGRQKAARQREKYIFSHSQINGIKIGREMLAEHKFTVTRLRSELRVLGQEETVIENKINNVLENINSSENCIKKIVDKMHYINSVERHFSSPSQKEEKCQLRDQKLRLDEEFSFMLTKVSDRKIELERLKKGLAVLTQSKKHKICELRILESKLFIMLEAQEAELIAIRKMQGEKKDEMYDKDGNQLPFKIQSQKSLENEKEQVSQLINSTDKVTKFGFMSMSMTYFSSLNMVRAMKNIANDVSSSNPKIDENFNQKSMIVHKNAPTCPENNTGCEMIPG
mgnify:CR=1 FL=1